jgi:glutamine amidotransferase
MANLEQYDLVDPIRRAIASGKPFLGICLGLQLLFTESEEFGLHKGLNLVPGRVKRFPCSAGPAGARLKVPHMGWNDVTITRQAPPLRGIDSGAHVYFVHSYYVEPNDPTVVCGISDYGVPFASSIWRENIFACQFHPEKSQAVGLSIIRNFGRWQL